MMATTNVFTIIERLGSEVAASVFHFLLNQNARSKSALDFFVKSGDITETERTALERFVTDKKKMVSDLQNLTTDENDADADADETENPYKEYCLLYGDENVNLLKNVLQQC